ncbi:DUF5064 family protein [Pseudomonas helleri]|uniref:DUF5064 family protein n=1 Tax=Pseudomonas helleri TaxID=1608996 RepID=UPI003FD06D38
MAIFKPGYLHIERESLGPHDFSYEIVIKYQVVQDPKEGKSMQFDMHGQINGKDFKESFTLPKDMAFDFARVGFKIAVKNGMPKDATIWSMHKQYDAMFEDVRKQLGHELGDPVKPEHLE